MTLIYETTNFILESHEKPEIDRLEGGHIKVSPKGDFSDRTELTPKLAIELMRLTIVAGKAMVAGMKKQGVNIGRINYQENGNWKPHLHIHLYGRAVDAKIQKYGDPIVPGHRLEFNPLNNDDIFVIKSEIVSLFSLPEYSDQAWGL